MSRLAVEIWSVNSVMKITRPVSPLEMEPEDVQRLLESMIAWTETQNDLLALYLYGSHAQGRANKLSDVDVALLAEPGLSRHQLWNIEDRWSAQWPEIVDLHLLNLAPLPFRYEVTAQGQRLWARNLGAVADWESLTWRRYWDLQPHLEQYWNQYVIEIMEQRSETERQQYETALAEVRAVHRRVREAAAGYDRDFQA